MPGPQLADIQGFILRTYAMPALRVLVLKVEYADPARQFLGKLVSNNDAIPQLATATDWTIKPESCVNLGITFSGLKALGVPSASLASFPSEFAEGAPARAAHVSDTGPSAPENWKGQLATEDAHLLLFVFGESQDIVERVTGQLLPLMEGLTELSRHDARKLPGNVAHFGYNDGFGQPSIDQCLPSLLPDVLPKAPTGEFLLGYLSQYSEFTYPEPVPPELGLNGSFMAFRILAQDCYAFEEFLKTASASTGLDAELVAAKLCGRWRNGVPIALSPDSADVNLPLEKYNSFDYVATPTDPDAVDDTHGYRCPIGSHIRRMNPRSSVVAGHSGLKRRIIRRGLPYGPPYDPANSHDGIERGLLGIFIGVSIKDQFEFLMADWANQGTFAPGLGTTRDPIIGDNSSPDSTFLIPRPGQKPLALTGLSRFVTTRGSAYCFLPSATATRYLATLPAALATASTLT